MFEHQFRHEVVGLETKFFWLPLSFILLLTTISFSGLFISQIKYTNFQFSIIENCKFIQFGHFHSLFFSLYLSHYHMALHCCLVFDALSLMSESWSYL